MSSSQVENNSLMTITSPNKHSQEDFSGGGSIGSCGLGHGGLTKKRSVLFGAYVDVYLSLWYEKK